MTTTPEAVEPSPTRSTDELMLDSMGATPTGFEIRTHAGGPQTADTLLFIADSMRSALDEFDAPHYLEMEVKASDGKRYIMNLQRAGKLTPHQARLNAEQALEALKPGRVTTEDELDVLPVGSVVLSDGKSFRGGFRMAFQRWDDGLWHRGARAGSTHPDNFLPATVLHEATK